MPRYASLQERILANSYVSNDPAEHYGDSFCWIWIGKISSSGYPEMTMRYKSGPRKGNVHNVRIHRLVIQLWHGKRMTPKMVGRHMCNIKICVNPAHLLKGSQKQNVADCIKAGRHKTPFRDPEKRVAS